MLQQGRYELKNILEDVPGVSGGAAANVNTSKGGGTDDPSVGLSIRGIQSNSGAGGSTVTTAAAAAFYVDDVYNGIGGSYDLNRVEVLRGPQGTLYGRSATAGVVAIHSNDPNTTRFGGAATVELGDYALHHFVGDLNIPIVKDQFAIRVSSNRYDRSGYYSADGGALSNTDFRLKALWTPTQDFSALLGFAENYNVTHSGGVTVNQVGSPTNFVYTPQAVAPGRNDFHQYWGNFNLDLGPVAVTYIPAYRNWYQDALLYSRGALNANQTVFTPTDTFLTQELRIKNTYNESKFKWQAGFLYYQNTLSNVNNLYDIDTKTYNYKSSTHKSTTAEGGFGEGTYSFTPDTRLTVGVRFDHTEVTTAENYTGPMGTTLSVSGKAGMATFNNFTYRVRLEHDLTPRNLLYASVSTGFTPGDITVSTDVAGQPKAQTLTDETLTTYEFGSKNRFLSNRLQVNGDVYYNDYGGFQTAGINTSADLPPVPGAPPGPVFTFNTITTPVKSYGAELEILARPWANGTLNLNASYTHARYGSFGQYAELFDSHVVPGEAPFLGSVSYDHTIPIGETTLLLHGAVRALSAHDTASITQTQARLIDGQPYAHVGNEAIADLGATLLIGHYSITGYVRNVTNNRYIPDGWSLAFVTPGAPGGPPNVVSDRDGLSDPRTFGVIVSVNF